jgi:hypothetical protein
MKKYSGPKDRVDAARDPSTPPEELAVLSTSEYVFVKAAVAINPSTPACILNALVPRGLDKVEDFEIAAHLLQNPHLPPRACVSLINRISERLASISPRDYYQTMAIEHLCMNQAVPLAPLRELLENDSFPKHLRGRVARKETRTDVLLILQNDKSESVRNRATRALEDKQSEMAKL